MNVRTSAIKMNVRTSAIWTISAAILAFVLGVVCGNWLGLHRPFDVDTAAKTAPLILATVAVLAFGSAMYGITVQRSIARKRAALDLFIKTELDRAIVDTYDEYNEAVAALSAQTNIEEFSKSKEYRLIRRILNIHELVAVGIHKDVLDPDVCFYFWRDELMDAFRDCTKVIEHARKEPKGTQFTYVDLKDLNTEWLQRHKKMIAKKA